MTKKSRKTKAAGLSAGTFKSAQHFNGHQVLNSSRGHGFAGEKLNTLVDKLLLKDAEIVGVNNLKKGPDRLVNGVNFQTKYCKTAKETVSALFENGKYAYYNSDGSPMAAEVPREQAGAAIAELKRRIANGDVPGVSDPEVASKLIRKGHVTYRQAANMAKAGTIESLAYDVATGAVISTYALGLTALVTFAHALWSGKEKKDAFQAALAVGIEVYSLSVLSHVGVQQLSRTAINSSFERSTTFVATMIPKSTRNGLAKAINPRVTPNTINSIGTVSKALRSNVLSSLVTTTILSTKDLYHFSRNEISGLQCFKNICTTGASVLSGGLGFWAGAALGAPLGPIGVYGLGFLGSLIAGGAGSAGAKNLLDLLGEDDFDRIKVIIEEQFAKCLDDYLVTAEEMKEISRIVQKIEWIRKVREIHASQDWERVTYKMFETIVVDVLNSRPIVIH